MSRPRLQHVSVPRPPGAGDAARAFYSGLLGFAERPVPESLHEFDLTWFVFGDAEIHLYAQEQPLAHMGRHFCVEVDDLAGLRARLEAAGYHPEDTVPIPGRPRFVCEDPFGNLIEFTTIEES